MKKIPLTQGQFALVDDEDFDYLSQWRWCAHRQKKLWYAKRSVKIDSHRAREAGKFYGTPFYKLVGMHQQLMAFPKDLEVDHIDGNGLNNQRSNLRLATRAENNRNRGMQRNNTSGFKGVSLHRKKPLTKPWMARIKAGGKYIHLGMYATAEEASQAYQQAALKYHGEFARID